MLENSTCLPSTDAGILNIQESAGYKKTENITLEPENIREWRITCVACHSPHETRIRTTANQLCMNCHSSEGLEPDGNTKGIRYTQWEFYNDSIFNNGIHAANLECIDCHMATILKDNTTILTGHSFDFNATLLSDPDSGNKCKKCHVTGHNENSPEGGCDECHDVSLSNIITVNQEQTKKKLHEMELLEENARIALTMIDDNEKYEVQFANYNNALFYVREVESDGSFGIHNMKRTAENLEMAEELFSSVIEEGKGKNSTAPGFGILVSMTLIMVAVAILKRN
ncbi:MAG: hypothetical protein R2741_13725 [Methanolobus sp.]